MSFFNYPIPQPPRIAGSSEFSSSRVSNLYPDRIIGPSSDWKIHVKMASTNNIDLNNVLYVNYITQLDSVVPLVGDRILLKDQTMGIENGIYIVVSQGSWQRSSDLDTGVDAASIVVLVNQGLISANTAYSCTNEAGSAKVGTDSLVFDYLNGGASIIDIHNIYPVVDGALRYLTFVNEVPSGIPPAEYTLQEKMYTTTGLGWVSNSDPAYAFLLIDGYINSSAGLVSGNSTASIYCGGTASSTSSGSGAITTLGGIGISNTTDATSATNGGTITTAGGVAIAKKLYVGSDINLTGTSSALNLTGTSSSLNLTGTSSAINISGTSSVLNLSGTSSSISVSGTTASTSNITGVIKTAGGIGISNTTDATSETNGGTITTAGGVAIAKKLYVGTDINLTGTSSAINLNGTSSAINMSGTNGAINLSGDNGKINFSGLGSGINGTGQFSHVVLSGSNSFISLSNNGYLELLGSNTRFKCEGTAISDGVGTASVRIYGGADFFNTTDSSSLTSGGTFTTYGGLSVGKTLRTRYIRSYEVSVIGDTTSSTVGFYGKTPIVQQTTAATPATTVINAGTAINTATTFNGYTIAQLVKILQDLGLIA